MKDHSVRVHSILGPSSAKRWMTCPGSIRASWGIPSTTSIHAKEGTAAHELAEMCLLNSKPAAAYIGTKIPVEGEVFTVDDDMASGVQVYVNTILKDKESLPGSSLDVEVHADLSWLEKPDFSWLGPIPDHFTEELSGSNDAIITQAFDCLRVYDLKFGRGIGVEVKNNPQLMMYALGALGPDNLYDCKTVTMVIVQPRFHHEDGPVREWTISVDELYAWANSVLRPAVQATQDPEAPLVAGDCGFCPALPLCKKAMDTAHSKAVEVFAPQKYAPKDLPKPELMTPEQLGAVLPQLDFLEMWAKSVREYVDETIRSGGKIPGYKLVAGSKRRSWTHEESETVKALTGKVTDLYMPGKFKSVAQVEKALKKSGKKKAEIDAILEPLVTITQGRCVAPESSKKQEIVPELEALKKAQDTFSDV